MATGAPASQQELVWEMEGLKQQVRRMYARAGTRTLVGTIVAGVRSVVTKESQAVSSR